MSRSSWRAPKFCSATCNRSQRPRPATLDYDLADRSWLYGSYEQSRLELWARIASRLTRLPYSAIKRGTYDDLGTATLVSSELRASEGWAQLERAARCLKVVEGRDALSRTEGAFTVDVLARYAERMAEANGAPPLIILDYLQRMSVPAEQKPLSKRCARPRLTR